MKTTTRLEHVGTTLSFVCKMCGKSTRDKYMLKPSPAIIELLDQWDQVPRAVCKGCARREVGSREWKIHVE